MDRIRDLSRDERGFTLIELLMAMIIGIIVLGAALTLMEVGARSSTRTTDRADVTQRGRTAMTAVTRGLRSQVCLNDLTPPIASGDGSSVVYYSDNDGDAYFYPQRRRVWLDSTWKAGRGAILESVLAADQTAAQGPGPSGWTFTGTPVQRVLVEDVTTVGTTAFLRYYSFDGTAVTAPLSADTTSDPLPASSIAKPVRVDVSYRTLPSVSSNATGPPSGNQTDPTRDADFETSIWLRNSDFTDQSQTAANRTWGPRCS